MTDWESKWTDPEIAKQQREMNDQHFEAEEWPPHFGAFEVAVRSTNCPGTILEVGCGVGHNREILDRAGVDYRHYDGVDISPAALALAKERYPESSWAPAAPDALTGNRRDIVIDGSCVLHVRDWRAHLANLCAASRRWVVLHRLPSVGVEQTHETSTTGYQLKFPAWKFNRGDVEAEMRRLGFQHTLRIPADGSSETLVFARPRHFATYCDSAYLPRLKALHASLVRHAGPFRLHVLAWDDGVFDWCRPQENVQMRHWKVLMEDRPELQIQNLPGPRRSKVEHYWTCGPQWIADVMEQTGEPVTYVDADVMFHSSPEPVFAEIGEAPGGVVPHFFAKASQGLPGPTVESHRIFGRFNVGLVHFVSPSVASDWAERCRAWCYDHVDGSKYGDQAYLDDWPDGGVRIIAHPGACLGPWAVHTRAIDVRDGVIHFGGRPLVAYHYSGLRELPEGHSVATRPEYQLTKRQEGIIYGPYYDALAEARR